MTNIWDIPVHLHAFFFSCIFKVWKKSFAKCYAFLQFNAKVTWNTSFPLDKRFIIFSTLEQKTIVWFHMRHSFICLCQLIIRGWMIVKRINTFHRHVLEKMFYVFSFLSPRTIQHLFFFPPFQLNVKQHTLYCTFCTLHYNRYTWQLQKIGCRIEWT